MIENLLKTAQHFSLFDLGAVVLFVLCWFGTGFVIERENPKRPSTANLMRRYRELWMEQMVTRQPRIFDAHVLGSLRAGANIFLSACMIAIGGGVALLGQADQLRMLATDISVDLDAPLVVWEAKILLVLLVLANAFLKFVWAVRLFGYCAIVMAAAPNDETNPKAYEIAGRAAKLNIYAARSFNRGLRAVYFALASLVWLLGPWAFMVATFATVLMLYRREFNSLSRSAILDPEILETAAE